ncbi:MAG: hypothetical protein IJ711_04220 [Lachnospiraceae bacterium]|nr:hypothetical protein [Lachnospiraceae bacterium]
MKYIRLSAVFLSAVMLCFLLELSTMLIPQKAIQKGAEKSALYYRDKLLFQEKVRGYKNTTVDYYADCILVNLIYEMDTESPVFSVLRAAYYDGENLDTDTDLLEAVFNGREANVSYGRYWHGSMIYLRPLLVFTDIKGIYLFLRMILIIGVVLDAGWMLYKREIRAAVCFLSAFVFTGGFWMSACIEYVNVMLLALCMIPLFLRAKEKGFEALYCLCVVDGVLTCFFDFLTAETLTITLPLLCVLCAGESTSPAQPKRREIPGVAVGGLVSWGMSYAGMFLVKWMLCGLSAGGDSVPDAFGRAGVYMQGSPLSAVMRNIEMLFPVPEGTSEIVLQACAVAWLILLVAVTVFLFWCLSAGQAAAFVMLAAVPYVRFLFLSGHSIKHCFFTYRAQMATLFMLAAAISEGVRHRTERKRS